MAACISPARWANSRQSFITLTSGLENLAAFGKTVLWRVPKIRFEEV